MTTPAETNTFACLLTSDAPGAIAVARVWGRSARAVADRVFRPSKGPGLAETPIGRVRVGRAGEGLGDEVVAVVLQEPRGEEVELQGHGGIAASGLLLDALRHAGASIVLTRQWLAWSSATRFQAEAMEDLARASTVLAAEILLDQTEGALDSAYRDAISAESAEESIQRLDLLIDRGRIGLRLLRGFRIALAGRPNVGKSCLLNALAGFERAIVSPYPGTTRDAVVVRLAIGGVPVEACDTAGLRDSIDPIELAGVALAKKTHARADLVLLLLDRSTPLTDQDRDLLTRHPSALVIVNKIDLPAAWTSKIQSHSVVPVSAETGEGLDDLLAAISTRLLPEPIPIGAGVPFRGEQMRALRRLRRKLKII